MKKMFILLFLLLLLTGCGKKETVIIYSAMDETRNQELQEQVSKKFTDIDVKIQAMSTGNLAAKIKNEKENVEADIVLDLETAHMENVKENFADLSEFDTSMYLDGVNKDKNYLIWVKYTMNLIIDNKYFKKNKLEIPKTYEDLLKSDYKNIIAMPDPKVSGTGYAFFINAVNEMGEDKAIKYFKKLKKNLREFSTSGSGPTNLLKRGEIAIAMGMTAQGVLGINEGYDFSIVELETGSPYNTTAFGIIKGKEKDKNVKEVFEWLLNDFSRYDKEFYYPDVILKDQKSSIKNYPTNLKDAKMNGINDMKTKEYLTQLWGKVNG